MLRPDTPAPTASPLLRSTPCVAFGNAGGPTPKAATDEALTVNVPLLAGEPDEKLLAAPGDVSTRNGCTVFDAPGETAGFVVAERNADLETAARDLYRKLFAATEGRHLYRVWNYVPQINVVEDGLENYRRFCRGRSLAFEAHFGARYQRQLPAASAVGATSGPLAIAFVAGEAVPRHFENPRQVPAFEYPADYGPRAPSFSRATLVTTGQTRKLFISGTAAIRGHATIAAGDLAGQLACTRENLNVIASTAGAGDDFGAKDGWRRTLKVYIRCAADLRAVQSDLERHLLRPGETVTYLLADLCRSDLLVEIEAVLTQ